MNIKNKVFIVIRIVLVILVLGFSVISNAEYEYEKIDEDGHIIHLVVIDPSEYEASLIAAHNQVFGREKVGDIAKRENAEIAINAGFFEIGDNADGRPTGTLASNGQIYGLRTTEHGCFVKNGDKYSVEIVSPSLEISVSGRDHTVSRFNRFANGTRYFYYNSNWGRSTLSSYSERREIASATIFVSPGIHLKTGLNSAISSSHRAKRREHVLCVNRVSKCDDPYGQ